MDYKVLALLVVFGIVMVMLGGNPYEAPKETGDPFRRSLEKKLKEEKEGTGGMGFFGQGTLGNPKDYVPSVPSLPGQMTAPNASTLPPQPGTPLPSAIPGSPPSTAPGQPDWATLINNAQNATTSQPNVQNSNSTNPRQAPAFYLKNGQQIEFSGFKVYTVSPDGQRKPLADGEYEMQSGDRIIIRYGKRQAR